MVKVLSTYQQTFLCSSAKKDENFNFSQVYKTDPSNKIRLSVTHLSHYSTNNGTDFSPTAFYLTGLPELSGKCNTLEVKGEDDPFRTRSNECLLGVIGGNVSLENNKGGSDIMHQPSFILNTLPLTDFVIRLENLARASYTTDSQFLVSFQIDICEY